MKDHLENSIKDSLEGFEAPFNPAAWEAMRARLDAKMPVTPPTSGGAGKWIIAAALITSVGVGAYFLLNSSNDGDEIQTAQTETTSPDNTSSDAANATQSSSANSNGNEAASQNGTQTNSPTFNPTDQRSPNQNNQPPVETPGRNPNDKGPIIDPLVVAGNGPSGDKKPDHKTTSVTIPQLENHCQNEVVSLKNTNEETLVVIGPELYFMVPANESRKIRLKKAGTYQISVLNVKNGPQSTFTVYEAPIVDFSVDPMTKYDRGLPTTRLEANVPGAQFDWVINGDRMSGTDIDAHFYTKGNHDVSLSVTASNGCSSMITKSIFIEDNYNLMAPTSFRPNSNDPAVSTFMPYALKERNVNFTMIILDPADGHILFETKDASMGWDGIDRKTGRPVDFENVYIWKVTLDHKARNEERNEYSGQVIPVHSSN